MTCPICDKKSANCDCTDTEREQFEELEEAEARAQGIAEDFEELREHCLELLDCATGFVSAIEINTYRPGHVDGEHWMTELAQLCGVKPAPEMRRHSPQKPELRKNSEGG